MASVCDPLDVDDEAGVCLVSLPGLKTQMEEFCLRGVRVARVPYEAWQLTEPNWIVDLYGDFYRADPKHFCVYSLTPPGSFDYSDGPRAGQVCMDRTAELVLALRLHSSGTLIHPHRTLACVRHDSVNQHIGAPGAVRMLTTSFGEGYLLPIKERRLGDRGRLYAPRTPLLVREAGYELAQDDLPHVEASLALYRAYVRAWRNPGVDIALDGFTLGHDVLLRPRERLVFLFSALEAVFGSYRRRTDPPSLGDTVACAHELSGRDPGGVSRTIERNLRPVRNSVMHGSDRSPGTSLVEAIAAVSGILRASLTPLLTFTAHFRALAEEIESLLPSLPGPTPAAAHRELLRLCAAGNTAAAGLLRRAFETPVIV